MSAATKDREDLWNEWLGDWLIYKKKVRNFCKSREGGKCFWCDKEIFDVGTLDHIIPKSKGGPYTPLNMVYSCYECNNERGDKDYEKFAKEKFILPL